MARYDLTTLSPQDFEDLARDLLQAEWNVPLESFRAGRDKGIDLRYAPLDGGASIVQCKHYAVSGAGKLISHLQQSEQEKVARLAPTRYVLFTSAALSVGDKDRIRAIMTPHVQTTGDIFGADEIEGMLVRHPDVVRATFKLWLTSTDVLERVLHNAEYTQSEFEVGKVRKKLPKFVNSDALPRAERLLESERVVIISGAPGIGKTTLAEMLLYAHLESGYQAVVIQSDLAEGRALYRASRKQIFYYDDFLGQTFLGDQRELVGRNQDAALLSFLEMVRANPLSRFVLTTREHILQQALQISERLSHSAALSERCVIELKDYSIGQRARILYNHMYFSDLGSAYLKELLREEFYLGIVKHKHFNPRLVEWLTTLARLGNPAVEEFRGRVAQLLDNPQDLWAHAFRTQISSEARDLILALYGEGFWCTVGDLEPAFESLHRTLARQDNRQTSPQDFRAALRELDGAFLSYQQGRVDFLNPSVREYAGEVIRDMPLLAMQLLASARRFLQVDTIWSLASGTLERPLGRYLAANQQEFLVHVERLAHLPSTERSRTKGWSVFIDTREEARLETLAGIANDLESEVFLAFSASFVDWLIEHWRRRGADLAAAARAVEITRAFGWFQSHGGDAIIRRVVDEILVRLDQANAEDWLLLLDLPTIAPTWSDEDQDRLDELLASYLSNGISEEIRLCSSEGDLYELKDSVERIGTRTGRSVSAAIGRIQARIDDFAEDESDQNVQPRSGRVSGPEGRRHGR